MIRLCFFYCDPSAATNDEVSASDRKETFRRPWPILSNYLSIFSGIVEIVKTSVAIAAPPPPLPRAQN
jgi:hypothetical protein